ncbi:hypothetical protein [Methylorubrum sp. POS3]|uniref:hypothetical protein n=1 Tax=Methylorubrum sp. POS3 TaxID=2998492 RepID=UPI00372BE3C7
MAEYSQNCTEIIHALRNDPDVLDIYKHRYTLPPRPSEAINEIKSAVLATDEKHALTLADIISWFQVSEARLREFRKYIANESGRPSNSDFTTAIVDSAKLYALSVRPLAWARGEVDTVGAFDEGKEIRSALFIVRIYEEDNEDVYGMADLYGRVAKKF